MIQFRPDIEQFLLKNNSELVDFDLKLGVFDSKSTNFDPNHIIGSYAHTSNTAHRHAHARKAPQDANEHTCSSHIICPLDVRHACRRDPHVFGGTQ